MKPDIQRIRWFDQKIQEIAVELGLDVFPQEFDVVPAQKMLEILAYRFPVNFSHWSFGRDYEQLRTRYEHGMGIPYEVVLNANPSRAYIMNTNPFPVQVLVMAHVYAHNDFMKNNFHFTPTRRDMLPAASEAALRFQRYEKEHGPESVERVTDAALSIERNVDPDRPDDVEPRQEADDPTAAAGPQPGRPAGPYAELLPERKRPAIGTAADGRTRRKRSPAGPERDLLLYIMRHSPKPLEEWEEDVLTTIRNQSLYFLPQMRTKIMNEGWATYWHMRIMERLFQEGLLDEEAHGFYNYYNAHVLASHPRNLNPYLVGLRIFEDIKERWDKGRFGREWEACEDPRAREAWNLGLGGGTGKLFEVRRAYSDRFFIEAFLTENLVERLQLYLYQGRRAGAEIQYVIRERDWKAVRAMLVASLSNHGIPLIIVEDGDYRGRRELYLKHAYDGIELDDEYRRKTMESVFYLWARPVHLESILRDRKVTHTYDGTRHASA